MTTKYKKKLIEVAIPLEAINAASAREKSIRHGHPSTLHLWWARRPLAACRAVLFAQLVDDPSEHVDELLGNAKLRNAAEKELAERLEKRQRDKEEGKAIPADDKPVALEDVIVELERQRLFKIIEDLVKWENSTNEEVLERARAEIRRSCDGELPPVYDPFSGGGSIPLEAQRLGLPAYGSDLNPVAVTIGKAMIEIPPKFKDQPPIHPGSKERNHYRNAEGLAEDVKYYGEWMREKAFERIGHLYPQVDLPKEYGGGKATAVAWIWARAVPSPDPAFAGVEVPIASNFLLSSKAGKEAWIEPLVDKQAKTISYRIRHEGTKAELEAAKEGTKAGRGANFICLLSGNAITPDYVKKCGSKGELGYQLLGIIAVNQSARLYLGPTSEQKDAAQCDSELNPKTLPLPRHSQYVGVLGYGLNDFSELHTRRQFIALETFSGLIADVRQKVIEDIGFSEHSCEQNKAISYANAIATYLACCVSRAADHWNTSATWEHGGGFVAHMFTRQAIPMVWDHAEGNPFSDGTGGWLKTCLDWVVRVLDKLVPSADGSVVQSDAQNAPIPQHAVISTDPPYYDNVPYADISDFFYIWLKNSIGQIYKQEFATLSVPKSEELVADRMRHDGADHAEQFFLKGMQEAMSVMQSRGSPDYPAAIYYAFKQSEMTQEGISSTGWASFLSSVLNANYSVIGTWPMRTERSARMRAIGSNALANSVVMVCRRRDAAAESVTRAEFIRALKRELPPAIAELQAANIAPADIPQSAIGPGMGVFSRYKAVLEADDSPMTVKSALQLINRELDEFLNNVQGEFDSDTRFAITWFEQNGMAAGDYGTANSLATARGISVDSVKHAGIVESAAGKVRILKRDELLDDWDPATDAHLTVWECCQYLIRKLETEGEYEAAVLLKKIGPDKADAVKDLAYCLYDICSNKRKDAKEATSYNALIAVWTELTRQAASIHETDLGGDRQTAMNF